MVSTDGVRRATSVRTVPCRRAMWLPEPSAMRTWTITACGAKSRLMGQCGFRVPWLRVGLLISTVIGSGLSRGAGPGRMTLLGDTLLSTTDAGFRPAAIGDGHRDRFTRVRCTLQRWWHGSAGRDGARTLALAWVADLGGARWVGVSHSSRGMAAASDTSEALTSATPAL